MLAKFHVIRALRLLRTLREQDEELFDAAFASLSVADREVFFTQDDQSVCTTVIALDDVKVCSLISVLSVF